MEGFKLKSQELLPNVSGIYYTTFEKKVILIILGSHQILPTFEVSNIYFGAAWSLAKFGTCPKPNHHSKLSLSKLAIHLQRFCQTEQVLVYFTNARLYVE